VERLLPAWYALLQGGLQLHAAAREYGATRAGWAPAALILLPTLLACWYATRTRDSRWPAERHAPAWRHGLLRPWLVALVLWSLGVDMLADGGMSPLPYLPLLNPVDLGHVLAALYAVTLWRAGQLQPRALASGAAVLGFVWLNGMLVRTLHHWAGTPMWIDGALLDGVVLTGLTILWATLALLAMLFATRRAPPPLARGLWLAGATLLAVVVAKLFLVDLSSVGALQRIVSFLGVGLLMLVIGYVSPLPPTAAEGAAR